MLTFTPLDDQVLVRRLAPETHHGRLHVPDRAKEQPLIGDVVAAGPGRRLDSGARLPCQLRPGQRVVFRKYVGDVVTFDGVEHLVIREPDVLGVIEDEAKPATQEIVYLDRGQGGGNVAT